MAFGHRSRLYDPVLPRHIVLAGCIVVLGAWLRFRGAQGDLWLDEIWSLNLTATLNAWHEVFWKLIHDNNHHLNTLWLYIVGEGREAWIYRLASIVAGTLSILVVGWAVARDGAAKMLIAMLLCAILYPLVHFGSEARGYGLMMLFTYVAFIAVDRAHDHRASSRWLFGLATLLAAASHLSSLPILFMMCVAYMGHVWRMERRFWEAFRQTLWFAAPAAGALAVIGGAITYGLKNITTDWYGGRATTCPPEGCFVGAWDELVLYATGGFAPPFPGLYAGFFALLIITFILSFISIGHRRTYLYGALFIGTPAIYLALNQPNLPFGRYFISVFAFVPLLIADTLGGQFKRSLFNRTLWGIALMTLIGVNAWGLQKFFHDGRGHYRAAVAKIENATTHFPITIGSDMVFRLSTVFDYYRASPVKYVMSQNVSGERPDWLVTVLNRPADMPPHICLGGAQTDAPSVVYKRTAIYRTWGLAGTDWGVYRIELNAPEGQC